jgi:8-oxo-dGTP pyrophosphatase MutT (NUDIX family)
VRWGLYGAAGVVFVVRFPDGPRVMLQKRSELAHEGGTWSCAGGALDLGEDTLAGALREASEEIGPIPDGIAVWGSVVFQPADDWRYTTFVVEVPTEFGASINFETDAVSWDSPDEVERRPLHAGFAAAWPALRKIIEADGRA